MHSVKQNLCLSIYLTSEKSLFHKLCHILLLCGLLTLIVTVADDRVSVSLSVCAVACVFALEVELEVDGLSVSLALVD